MAQPVIVGDKRILAKFVQIICRLRVVIRAHARNLRAVVHITTKLEVIVNSTKTTKIRCYAKINMRRYVELCKVLQ